MSPLFVVLLIATTTFYHSDAFAVKRDHHMCDRTGKACLNNAECCRNEKCVLVDPNIRCFTVPCGTACVKR
uniref:Putative venom toxin Ts29 n=1 Tax=Tityus serrulatus TaxID=6887 RepID=TS29_TITSE|nr:RecName: Full=Putative venom toxin Ts29; AltName: Full=Tityustoxin-29; Flags: Precursor [Tityus serrulatus]QPD99057.1 putative Venom toxin Ts29 [Tityus serrulatus]